MGKVVTSKGLTDFVQSGTVTHVEDHNPKKAEALEVKKEPPVVDLKPPEEPKSEIKTEVKEPEKPEAEEAEPVMSEQTRKYVNRQHRLAKEAQEQAEDAERFAKGQYERARLAEQKQAELERDLAEARKQVQPSKEPELKEPDENDPQWVENGQFNWRKFTKAQAAYEAAKAVSEDRKKQAEERQQQEQAVNAERIRKSADDARKTHPDFDAVMEAAKGTEADIVPQFVLNYIYESEKSAEVAYYLAKNPEESQRIAKMKPILGLAELGKLEDKLSAKPAEEVKPQVNGATPPVIERGGAPPPITPILGGTGTVNTDPSRMSFKELREFEKQRNKRR